MAESSNKNDYFPQIPFAGSESFHSTDEGKIWTRLLINLCWWLHDMYEIKSTDQDAKFDYIDEKIKHCQELFPAQFTLMFSDPTFSPNDQHPLLICRQEEHQIIILVFRATVSSKSIQDVFTDASIYSNHQVYLGDRHSGFAQRVETAPLMAVTNWLRRGWKVLITGHSLGGAVSQLFTAQVISKLVEAGLTPELISLRCVTFGTPQCADYHFWSSYTAWYNVFDTYIYGHDAIFRLATFGAAVAKQVVDSFGGYLRELGIQVCSKVIGYRNEDLTNIFANATNIIRDITRDALIPVYSVFGRHHFIRKDDQCQFKIDTIGELQSDKIRLLEDLSTGSSWYDYFVEKTLIPNQLKFIYREFMEHGCYPFSINQLFNRNVNSQLRQKSSIQQNVLRIRFNSEYLTNNKIANISGIINFPNEINRSYIYFEGFLVDFITSVQIPIELAESEQSRDREPTLSQNHSDECAVLCFKSDKSIKYLQKNPWFDVRVKTYFGFFNVQVVVLSNFNSTSPSVYQLNPISTISGAYWEFVLDASSVEQIDSTLSHCFSCFFAALEHIGENKVDIVMARYFAEAQARHLLFDDVNNIQDWSIPETEEEAKTFFDKTLVTLKTIDEDNRKDSEIRHNASFLYLALKQELDQHLLSSSSNPTSQTVDEHNKLIPLNLNFVQLRQHIQNLHGSHTHYNIDQNREAITTILAPFFFILIKLKRLPLVKRYTEFEKVGQTVGILYEAAAATTKTVATIMIQNARLAEALLRNGAAASVFLVTVAATQSPIWMLLLSIARNQRFGDYQMDVKPLCEIASAILTSVDKNISGDQSEWQVLKQIAASHWSRPLTQTKSPEGRDIIWAETFKNAPLKDVLPKHRWNFVGVIEICRQLCAMRRVLAQQPPKVVITGQSQTGKSTLFSYLTRRNLEELRNTTNFNTRMSIQCRAFIQLDDKSNGKTTLNGSALPINLIDSRGYDDATGQSEILLNMSLSVVNLVIVVATLKDVNQAPTIRLLNKILNDTRVKILVLINQVDLRLKEAREKYQKGISNIYEDSEDDVSGNDESDHKFSACETLDEVLKRPQEELIQKLDVGQSVVNSRVTFQPVILKGLNELHKTFRDVDFRNKVHKSNVNKWIKCNLINTKGSQQQ